MADVPRTDLNSILLRIERSMEVAATLEAIAYSISDEDAPTILPVMDCDTFREHVVCCKLIIGRLETAIQECRNLQVDDEVQLILMIKRIRLTVSRVHDTVRMLETYLESLDKPAVIVGFSA